MKINKLTWDSEFFHKNIGELFLEDSNSQISCANYDLIVVKQKENFDVKIPGYFEAFNETKILYEKELVRKKLFSTLINDTDFTFKNWGFFKELAYESGKYSRFNLDKNFAEKDFHKLYNEWIINSLNKKFAIKTFYTTDKNFATGFVTVSQSKRIGKIGLIATHPKYQGQGLGRQVLEFTENFCLDNGMATMEIPTQKANFAACRFYEKLGYHTKEELIIKHFWKNDAL